MLNINPIADRMHREFIREMATKISPENLRDENFIFACQDGDLELAKKFVSEGVNIHVRGDEAVARASERNRYEVVKWLLENNADPCIWKQSSFSDACFHGYTELVKLLLTTGKIKLNADNGAALKYAVSNGDLEIVKLLINAGASIRICKCAAYKIAKHHPNKSIKTYFDSLYRKEKIEVMS